MALQPGDVVVTIKIAKQPNDGGDAPTKEEIDAVPSFPPKPRKRSIEITKYSDDEERDDRGRWVSSNGAMTGKMPHSMAASEINKELDRLDARSSKNTQALIDAGRGNERFTESAHLADPLATERIAVADRHYALHDEIKARYGPGAPSRLPSGQRGFGPRKQP